MQTGELTPEAADQLVLDIVRNRVSVTDISPSPELFRALDRYHDNRVAATNSRLRDISSNQPSSRAHRITIDSQRERLQRMVDILTEALHGRSPSILNASTSASASSSANQPSSEPPSRALPNPPSTSSSADPRRRPPLTNTDRLLERQRRMATARFNAGRVELQNETRHLRQLLDESVAIIAQPLTAQEYAGEAEANRAIKRRKLDSGNASSAFSGFPPYGRYGQVEPGKLNMEIHSCDGGIFNDERGAKFAADNVLKMDKSVYCTKGNRCNLVLQHQGGTPFTLTELIIKAPPRGYTAPVQEGMVFISMTSDDLLNRTASYQIQYSPSKSRRRPSQDEVSLAPGIFSIRHNPDGTIENITRIANNSARPRQRLAESPPSDDEDSRQAQIPDDFTHENSDSFHVTCECSDDEDDSRPRRPPNRIGSLRFEESDNEESEDELDLPWDNIQVGQTSSSLAREIPPQRFERRSEASRFSISQDLEAAQDAAQEATQEAVRAVGGGLMSPLCKFFIERDKSKCTIKFTPEVSGRFILLKLWSPIHERGGNIDIQNIIVKGFAGPRFFPAGRLM